MRSGCNGHDGSSEHRSLKPFDDSPEADRAAMEAEFASDNLRPLSSDEIEAEKIEDDIHEDHRRPRI